MHEFPEENGVYKAKIQNDQTTAVTLEYKQNISFFSFLLGNKGHTNGELVIEGIR